MLYDSYCWLMCCLGIGYFMEGPSQWILEQETKNIKENMKKVKLEKK